MYLRFFFYNFFVIFFISLRPWPAHFITARNKQMWPTTAQTKLVGTVLTQTTATSQQHYKVRFHSSGTMHNLHSNFLLINYIQHNKTTLNHTDCSQGLQLDYLQNYVPSLSILYSPVNQCFLPVILGIDLIEEVHHVSWYGNLGGSAIQQRALHCQVHLIEVHHLVLGISTGCVDDSHKFEQFLIIWPTLVSDPWFQTELSLLPSVWPWAQDTLPDAW